MSVFHTFPEPEEVIPQVSWLLCTHREDELLHRAVQSCLSQTVSNFELLLVVNGPRYVDIVASLEKSYGHDPRVRVVGTAIHLLNFSLSLGLHLAKAPFVARMDADDIASPERLMRQITYMELNPLVAVLGTAYQLIDSSGREHGSVVVPLTNSEIRRALYYRNPICHPSVMLRREAILMVGGYLGGHNAEDYDLWLRIWLDSRWQFANLPELLLSYNVEPGGEARRSRKAYANMAAAQWRNLLITRDFRWLLGALITCIKSFVRAKRS